MPTRKKTAKGNSTRENFSPAKDSRPRKKVSESVEVEKKVSELITSSARKPRVGTLSKKVVETVAAPALNTRQVLVYDEPPKITEYDAVTGVLLDHKGCGDVTGQPDSQTIFSPSFHLTKNVGVENGHGVDFIKFFQNGDQNEHHDSAMEHSEVDILRCHNTQKVNGSISTAEKNSSEEAINAISRTCLSNMEVDTNASYIINKQSNGGAKVPSDTNATVSCCNADNNEGANLSSEVSAIYRAMKNSKLECDDEHGQDSISMDVEIQDEEDDDDDDSEEFEEFDPYFFIKSLPKLSSIVPTFRATLLPKQTRRCPPTTLVLDLDETLVHSSLEPCSDVDFTFPVNVNKTDYTVYVRCRPHLKEFMERISGLFEIIIFTASQSIYAEQLLNVLDPKRKYFRHRVYRDSCVYVEGNYLKDLSVLGRDLSRVIIVDNSPQAFGFQVDNGIPIESWFEDRSDQELIHLLPFLESLVKVEDVRPLIAKKFNLKEKIAAAVYPPPTER